MDLICKRASGSQTQHSYRSKPSAQCIDRCINDVDMQAAAHPKAHEEYHIAIDTSIAPYWYRRLQSRLPSMNTSKLVLHSTLICLYLTQFCQPTNGETDLLAVSSIEKCTQRSNDPNELRSCSKKLKLLLNVKVSEHHGGVRCP